VTALSVVVAALLMWRWRPVLILPLAVIAASLSSHALKPLIGRERPPEGFRLVAESNHAMPSGHATGMAALAMVFTLWWWPRGGWWRVPVAGAWGLAAAVAWTRLYLGVHWFSDVLAGLILGGVVAFLTAGAAKRLTLS
jgi:undecaprenyl-diphosphatase